MDYKIINEILEILLVDHRAAIGTNFENDTLWNNSVLPIDLKKTIDDVYHKLEQIMLDNGIKGTVVMNLIEDKRLEINQFTENLFDQKANKQLENMKYLLYAMPENEEENSEKRKQYIRKGLEDEAENELISERVEKEMIQFRRDVIEVAYKELMMNEITPQELKAKIIRVNMEAVIALDGVKENIRNGLSLNDAMTFDKINEKLDSLTKEYIDKEEVEIENSHEKFSKSIKAEIDQPKALSITKEEINSEEIGKLDPFVIE